jgi:hypothetical protein
MSHLISSKAFTWLDRNASRLFLLDRIRRT